MRASLNELPGWTTGRSGRIYQGMILQGLERVGFIVWDASRPNGQPRRCLDVTRVRQFFGFEATHDLRAGIARTVAWFTQHDQELREVVYAWLRTASASICLTAAQTCSTVRPTMQG